MNSTCSFQPRWAKSSTVEPLVRFNSKVNSVPIHSFAPSTHCHLTLFPGAEFQCPSSAGRQVMVNSGNAMSDAMTQAIHTVVKSTTSYN